MADDHAILVENITMLNLADPMSTPATRMPNPARDCCAACGALLTGGYFFLRDREERYCPACIADRPRCDACSAPLGAQHWRLHDGRLLCARCHSTAVYDPATDSWDASKAPATTLREHVTASAVDGRILLIGGRWAANVHTVEAYDPATDTWATLPDLPTARGGLTSATVDGLVHVTGGEEERGTFPQHEVFDPTTAAWTRYPDLPSRRHGLASGAIHGRWVVAGGGKAPDLSVSDIVEIWSP